MTLNMKCLIIFPTLLVMQNAHTRCPPSPGKIYTANTANASDVSGRSRMSEMPEGIEGQKNKSHRCIRQKYGRSVMATNIGTWMLPHCSSLMSGPISAIKGSRAAHSVKWRSGNFEDN